MRIGRNPQRDKILDKAYFIHQIVIPVYIPHNKGYFKDSLKILELCLNSLLKTVHSKTFITIVNNGSYTSVIDYLNELCKNEQINEVIHTTNIGKNNAIIKGVTGHYFDYVTIADADVIFLNGWQDETINIYNSFPKVGVVGLVPQFRLFSSMSFNVLFDNFWNKKLSFTPVKNVQALKKYYKSLGWNNDYNKDYLKYIMTLSSSKGTRAVVGSGHVVATYKRDAVGKSSEIKIEEPLSPKLDRELLDKHVLKFDSWRLTTDDNYAYHMGNVYEGWMINEVVKLKDESTRLVLDYPIKPLKKKVFKYFVKNHLFRKFLNYKIILKYFLIFKGLPKKVAKTY